MSQVIIYPQQDNKLAVLIPVDPAMTIEQIAAKDVPAGTPFAIVENPAIAPGFFDAYEYRDGAAVFVAEKGREIQLERWRKARVALLDQLDVAYMRADEAGDTANKAAIAAQKQALRDVTETEIPGTTPEDIAAAWSEILGENPYV